MTKKLTHLDETGQVRMVDVGAKPPVRRVARAEAFLVAAPETLDRLEAGDLPKGEALAAARLAAIAAAKRTDELIPLCHTLPLEVVEVDFERTTPTHLRVHVRVATTARTGVEMEALTAAAIAALTLYDMTKAVDKEMRVDSVRVVEKIKG